MVNSRTTVNGNGDPNATARTSGNRRLWMYGVACLSATAAACIGTPLEDDGPTARSHNQCS
jgi:hypothetical protein